MKGIFGRIFISLSILKEVHQTFSKCHEFDRCWWNGINQNIFSFRKHRNIITIFPGEIKLFPPGTSQTCQVNHPNVYSDQYFPAIDILKWQGGDIRSNIEEAIRYVSPTFCPRVFSHHRIKMMITRNLLEAISRYSPPLCYDKHNCCFHPLKIL